MRIVYVADIHGGFDRVKTLLTETVADVYIIAGDLIDIPFYNMSTAINYHELQSYLHGLRVRMQKENMHIEDFVDELLDTPNTSAEIEEKIYRKKWGGWLGISSASSTMPLRFPPIWNGAWNMSFFLPLFSIV